MGYYQPEGGPDSANEISRSFGTTVTLTRIELRASTDGPFCDPYGCWVRLYANHSPTSRLSTSLYFKSFTPVPNGEPPYVWEGSLQMSGLGIGQYESQQPTLRLLGLKLFGTGVNPFCSACVEEAEYQHNLDTAFADLKTALQNNPTAAEIDPVIATPLNNYKTTIQTAFGVTFSTESGASDWGAVSLHFAHLGLQATAEAFERWVEAEIVRQGVCRSVGRFDLFRRIMGQMTLMNAAEEQDNVALTTGTTIRVYRKPGANRQWVMTPNNLIHELGHRISRLAGFGFPQLGSIENTLDAFLATYPLSTRYDRDGMGDLFLRQQIVPGDFSTLYYVYATVEPDGENPNMAAFIPITSDPVLPDDYLLSDLFGANYNLWNSPYNIYPPYDNKPAARVDLFVHNYPLLPGNEPRAPEDIGFDFTRRSEITADSFLNWVRGAFEGAKGDAWQDFFEGSTRRIGMFLRNAVIYQAGMKTHFQSLIFPPSEQRVVRSGAFQVRLAPVIDSSTSLGKAYDENDPDHDLDLQSTRTYGWAVNDGEEWFLIEDNSGRLVWITVAAIIFDPQADADKDISRQISEPLRMSPGREYSDDDLLTIVGT